MNEYQYLLFQKSSTKTLYCTVIEVNDMYILLFDFEGETFL
jgi:hypothetical protein